MPYAKESPKVSTPLNDFSPIVATPLPIFKGKWGLQKLAKRGDVRFFIKVGGWLKGGFSKKEGKA